VSREQLFAAFFFAVFLFLLYQAYLFIAPFLAPLTWAAILALTFFPLTTSLVRLFRGRRSLAAAVLVVAVTVLAILPAFYLGSVLVAQATEAYRQLNEAVRDGRLLDLVARIRASPIGGLWARAADLLGQFSIDPSDLLLRATSWVSDQIVSQAGNLARNVLGTVVSFFLMLVALFFFFRDGDAMAIRLRELLPMDRDHKDALFARFSTTLTAVVQSMIVTAVAQGLLSGVGYWLIGGLTFSVFLGFLTGLSAFLPIAGPALVWGGTALYLLLIEHAGRALGLALWGALVVSTADNWIKPLFIGGRANLPTFPLLLSILGGLQAYGFLGVFLGPVVLAILMSFVDIYSEEYRSEPAPGAAPEALDRVASG
jgi:predicted PurR-regulated permease PerM